MSATEMQRATKSDDGGWGRKLSPYRKPKTLRGLTELAITAIPFTALWLAIAVSIHFGLYWLYALLVFPAAGLLVRLFMIQHDCGHDSFFPSRQGNAWVGRAISILTLMPYDQWRRAHAVHHATAGNLDRRGIGDVTTLTVDEYLARSFWGRLGYRLYRHPAVMFGIGPMWLFLLQSRLPVGFMRRGWKPWLSVMGTNLGIALAVGLLIWTIGLWAFLMIHLPIVLLGATAGVWLFYVQHQFEETHWAEDSDWTIQDAALQGSSHYDLPWGLRWMTANIGVHHVHHLASRIPFYRLPEVLNDYPELRGRGRLTLWKSLSCVGLVLWDDETRRLISFADLRKLQQARSA
ncbi:fatty acid desaturase [Acidisoma sp.]|uniref:fatty acid desaturase n=1 Tax=Acidisoma sp. TaxID=1872115 RepID=UPI003B00061E